MYIKQSDIDKHLKEYQSELKSIFDSNINSDRRVYLTGIVGELYIAKMTEGQMAAKKNQDGYDVISKYGDRISVKNTASIDGKYKYSLNNSTLHLVDKVALVQVDNNADVKVLFFDDLNKAKQLMVYKDEEGRQIIKLSKLHNLNKYFTDEKYEYSCPRYDEQELFQMNRYDFHLNGKNYSMFKSGDKVRLIIDNKCQEYFIPELKVLCDSLGLTYGIHTKQKTLANRILVELRKRKLLKP